MPVLLGLIRTMRPKQWTKNLLFVFPALIFDGQLFILDSFLRVFATFVLLCLMSGTVYIINDIVDIESDRLHPRKRNRPLPSGQLPLRVAIAAAVILPVVTLLLALALSVYVAIVLAVYLGLQLWYSFQLKHVVIVDVLAITVGFLLRVVAGAVVIKVADFSPWLYVCAALLALFLAVGKRRTELLLLGDKDAENVRPIYRSYNLLLLDQLLMVVTTSTFLAYTLYTIETTSRFLSNNYLALFTIPFVLYGLFRYLYLIYVAGETGAPDEVLLKDRALQVDIVLFGLSFIVILYVLPAL
ncbi:MAG TPA: decaprenyl-phosphate phosphoribosyltransferase [Aggregatilineales bacterium]|nr:decaprenyl-phosphate phosphoribosyltransferase [Aggregatilineales bacterium]